MNLAVIGSGGREHSICYKLKQSNKINKLICIPGNAGTRDLAENINIDIKNFQALILNSSEINNFIQNPTQSRDNQINVIKLLAEKFNFSKNLKNFFFY